MILPAFAFLALLFASAPAAAEGVACALEVRGDAAGAWIPALEEVRRRLNRLAEPHDCAAVRFALEDDRRGATLLFRSRSGREAARRVAAPEELTSTLEALLVTLAPTAAPPEPPPAPRPPPPRTAIALPAEASPAAARVALLTGSRIAAFPGAYLGPVFRLEGGTAIGAWEFAGALESAPLHVPLSEAPSDYGLATHALAFAVGRRHDFGAFALAYGGLGALQVLSMHAAAQAGALAPERSLEKWQPRLGLYGAAIVSLGETLAFRGALHAETAVAKFADPGAAARELPSFPRVSATLAFGLEATFR